MPFKPGHPGDGNRSGQSRAKRLSARNLAVVIRETLDVEQIFWWLRCVMAGVDPDEPSDTKDDPRRKWEVARDSGRVPDRGYTLIENTARLRALETVLAYGFGQPAQRVVIEAEIRALQGDAVTDTAMRALTDDEVRALARLDQIADGGGNTDASSGVVDAEVIP